MRLILFFALSVSLHLIFFLQAYSDEEPLSQEKVFRVKVLKEISSNKLLQKKYFSKFNKLIHSLPYSLGENLNSTNNTGSAHENLYQFINSGLTFPSVFQKFKIKGTVQARLFFDSKGNFIFKNSTFSSSNGFLRFHIMSYLRRRLQGFKFSDVKKYGYINTFFSFSYTTTTLKTKSSASSVNFVFERIGYGTNSKVATTLNEIGLTLISVLNLLKFRPEFLKTQKELVQEQAAFDYLEKIKKHKYYK